VIDELTFRTGVTEESLRETLHMAKLELRIKKEERGLKWIVKAGEDIMKVSFQVRKWTFHEGKPSFSHVYFNLNV